MFLKKTVVIFVAAAYAGIVRFSSFLADCIQERYTLAGFVTWLDNDTQRVKFLAGVGPRTRYTLIDFGVIWKPP